MIRAEVAVVGGGITGLAAAHRVAEQLGRDAVILIEADSRLGGKIITERVDGFVVEGGPDCFLGSKPAGVALCDRLGLSGELRGTNPAFRRSFVRRGGRLYPLPDGLSGLVPSRITPLATARLLSIPGRVRAALELLVPRGPEKEESVAGFTRRRFGAEAYDWLVEPLLSGIYAGDGEVLSLDAAFPHLREMETRSGGVLRGMLWRPPPHPVPTAQPAGFVTLAGGLGRLVEALQAGLGRIMAGSPVCALRIEAGGVRLRLADGTDLEADQAILAVPAHAAARLTEPLDPLLSGALREVPFVSTATVSLGFPLREVPQVLGGFGWVSPRAAGGAVVACTWTSNKFPGRAPPRMVLLRFFIGRAGNESPVSASDPELLALAREEARVMHGIRAEPVLQQAFRWPLGMPQYTLGHRERMGRVARRMSQLPGLFLAGASYGGVGIPDCIASGWAAAEAATARLGVA